jgi:hypothetical protein
MDMDSIESSDIEMGSAVGSASLADQDGQDGQDGQDSQDSQDGQDDSMEDIGSRVGGGMTTQGVQTSPRRTRSGKIVKYRDD